MAWPTCRRFGPLHAAELVDAVPQEGEDAAALLARGALVGVIGVALAGAGVDEVPSSASSGARSKSSSTSSSS